MPDSFKDFVRFEQVSNLFYDGILENEIQVLTDKYKSNLRYGNGQIFTLSIFDNQKRKNGSLYLKNNEVFRLDNSFNYKTNYSLFFTKKYDFKKLTSFPAESPNFLLPPYGENLLAVLYQNKELAKEVGGFFKEYNLKFGLSKHENKLKIRKDFDEFFFVEFPYSSMADTLQRIIFYLTAIESNKNSVLLFEEPEAHSFPPYIRMLADRITADEANQYFIATHSPYLFENLLGKINWNDLSVNIVYFEDYQTKIKTLSQENLQDALDNSVDIFFNLHRYLDHE
ncbi:MAG: ATP/GTP-binding protein [Thermoflexibacter sp.]